MPAGDQHKNNISDIVEMQSNYPLLVRLRVEQLLTKAIECPLVIVTAGAGYGKTRAVTRFLLSRQEEKIMISLNQRDNNPARFWEHYTHVLGTYNSQLGQRLAEIDFPKKTMMHQYYEIIDDALSEKKDYIVVFDDFHCITNSEVLDFFNSLIEYPSKRTFSFIIISRTEPALNIMAQIMKGSVAFVSEDDLRFTKQEIGAFLKGIGVSLTADNLAAVCADTKGWAFSLNLIGMSLKKTKNVQFARSSTKSSIFKLLNEQLFSTASPRLRHFLVQLSLIDFLSVPVIKAMAKDQELIAEFESFSSFIRYDTYLNAYRIHHLLLDFLLEQQDILTDDEKQEAWQMAATWCVENKQFLDAISYYEKMGQYASICEIIDRDFPQQQSPSCAAFLLQVFENAPKGAFDDILMSYVLHMRSLLSLNRVEDAVDLANKVIKEYKNLPVSYVNCRVLLGAYIALGVASWMRATLTDVYDFDLYFERVNYYHNSCHSEYAGTGSSHHVSAYASMVGTTRAGAFEDYIAAMERTAPKAILCLNGNMAGLDYLAKGELLFYKADLKQAEIHVKTAFSQANQYGQYEIRNRALYYLLRIYIAQGKYENINWVINQLELQLDIDQYHERQTTYDIVSAWYYTLVGSTGFVAPWLSEAIEEDAFGEYVMNFVNLIKARIFYETQRYQELLYFTQSNTRLKHFLLGRIEIKVLEALCQYQMKNRSLAFEALESAYQLSKSNDFLMPFIEHGKHMRTLTTAAKKSDICKIPDAWLEDVNRRSAVYAKQLNLVINDYRDANGLSSDVQLSALEKRVLSNLVNGLSRSEIAAQLDLSINTIKSVINMVYLKLDVKGRSEAIRVAVERKLL
jgi:LuxR family maltose regulon positive regulatory protein